MTSPSAYSVGPYLLKEATYRMEQVGSTLVWPVLDAEATSFEAMGRMLELQAQEGVRRFFEDNEWKGVIPVAGREPDVSYAINTRRRWKPIHIGYGALSQLAYSFEDKAEIGIRFVQWGWKDIRVDHRDWIKNVVVQKDRHEISVIQGWSDRFPGGNPHYLPI